MAWLLTPERTCELAVAAERGIQTAVGVVTDHGKIRGGGGIGCAGHEDFSIRLYRHSSAFIRDDDIGRLFAIDIKGSVQRTVGVVTRNGKIAATGAGHDKFAVRLQRDIACIVKPPRNQWLPKYSGCQMRQIGKQQSPNRCPLPPQPARWVGAPHR